MTSASRRDFEIERLQLALARSVARSPPRAPAAPRSRSSPRAAASCARASTPSWSRCEAALAERVVGFSQRSFSARDVA